MRSRTVVFKAHGETPSPAYCECSIVLIDGRVSIPGIVNKANDHLSDEEMVGMVDLKGIEICQAKNIVDFREKILQKFKEMHVKAVYLNVSEEIQIEFGLGVEIVAWCDVDSMDYDGALSVFKKAIKEIPDLIVYDGHEDKDGGKP